MFNTYLKAYQNLRISATSGTLTKSHPKSFTIAYEFNSTVHKMLHSECPRLTSHRDKFNREQKCVIIQSMIIGERSLLSEIVWLDDYLESEGE